jgi:hypothetical protein
MERLSRHHSRSLSLNGGDRVSDAPPIKFSYTTDARPALYDRSDDRPFGLRRVTGTGTANRNA